MPRNVAILAILAAMAPAVSAGGEGLSPVLLEMQKRELADLYEAAAAREAIQDAGVSLGTWRRIGPFRDQPGVSELLKQRKAQAE